MTLGSASIGTSYALTPKVNVFANVAKADQIPADTELDSNPNLKKASNRNVELGLKGRSGKWSFDTSIYNIKGTDEVVRLRQADGQSQYVNAGGTAKKGFELSGSYAVTDRVNVGGGYGYNRYKYTNFQELISGRNVERSGNYLPFIPKTQTSLFAEYKHPNGVSARVQARKDGAYYMDNANSEQWQNKDVITDLNVGYGKGKHKVDLMVDNVFDKRYAVEVSKDTAGKTTYSAGTPRAVLVNYSYQF
jgi:iron complex outermembrane receptor protein